MTVKTQKARVVVEDADAESQINSESEDCNHELTESDVESDIDLESNALLNEGWADAVAKILKTNKPKKKRTLVLSKAKKLTDPVKKVVKENYEIATANGVIRKEETIIEEKQKEVSLWKKKRELPILRVKPNILEKDRERTLQKIATKGVVQLFNAVKMQQKDISQKLEEAGPLEVRKEKVLKNIDKRVFLDVLMGEKSNVVDEELKKTKDQPMEVEKTDKNDSTWNVLREDFMLSAKLKDWDKELENEESEKEMEVEEEIESD